MNNVVLVGRLTDDPKMFYSTGENASATCRFSVAVQRPFKNKSTDQYEADFPNCVAFSNNAEFVNKYFHKGDPIGVSGRIQTGSYTNKDGVKVYTTDVVVDRAEFVGSKGGNSGEATSATTSHQAPDASFMNIPDDADENLPF